jgi:magnesium-protoporphyrin IX monomethyl ester (oxidative) cyclase
MVFVTHTLTVYERSDFYDALGLDATEFDRQVIRETNATAARAFSVVLDTEHPDFYRRLQRCSDLNLQMSEINHSNQPKLLKFCRKLPKQAAIAGHLLRLYLMKPVDAEAAWATVH